MLGMKRSVSGDVLHGTKFLTLVQLNYLHRLAGLFAVVAVNVHAIGYSAS